MRDFNCFVNKKKMDDNLKFEKNRKNKMDSRKCFKLIVMKGLMKTKHVYQYQTNC